jgi:LSD1 subclass zinc finger protein
MKLSVIVPAYNEQNTIEAIIERVMHVSWAKQVIVVDDGSTDDTREILHHMQGNIQIRCAVCFTRATAGRGSDQEWPI